MSLGKLPKSGHGRPGADRLHAGRLSLLWALLTLLHANLRCCAALRHDDSAPLAPPRLGDALLQEGRGEERDYDNMTSLRSQLQILCGGILPLGHNLTLHCDQHLEKIREVFQVPNPQDVLDSNNIDLGEAEKGTGRSGAKMLFSSDKRFIIKSMSARDIRSLTPVIHKYTMHVVNHASTTLLMRFYGLLEDSDGNFWIIANNWLSVDFPISWDLKGSTSGRANGLDQEGQKDNDWTKANREIALAPSQRDEVLGALRSDSSVLADANLIDYSLIVGRLVYDLAPCGGRGQPSCISPVCHPSAGCGETVYNLGDYYNNIKGYYCGGGQMNLPTLGHSCTGSLTKNLQLHFACYGLIDLLKPYDTKSSAEYVVRGGVFGRGVSVAPPEDYAQRFFKFMHHKVFRSSAGTVVLSMDSATCSAWGSRQQGQGGGFPVKTVIGSVLVAASLATFGVWYYMNHQDPSPGGEGEQQMDPSYQSAYPQGYGDQTYGQMGYPAQYAPEQMQGYAQQGQWPQAAYPAYPTA